MIFREIKIKILKPLPFLLLIFILLIVSQSAKTQWKPVHSPLLTKWATEVSPENVWQEYPRPQIVREKWLNLNGLWDYAIRPKEEGIPSKYDGKILVPFCVESALSGVGKTVGEKNNLWYHRTFEIPDNWTEQRMILRFEAVDWETKVWVNGKYAGTHLGGYDRAVFDITPFLNKEGVQDIVVSVWDPVDSGTQPRGKQVQNPNSIWYTSVTGIWQTVWIEPLQKQNIELFRILPLVDKDSVNIKVTVVNENKTLRFEARVYDGDKLITEGGTSTMKALRLGIPDAKKWSPDSPFLYDVIMVLYDQKGNVVDSLKTYFGMRKISLGKDSEGITRIMLNDKFVFQLGLLDQGWWPDGLYTAPTDDALRYDIEMTKKMGFNLARKHVKVEPDRWYYWADKLGLLVWQDMPSGDEFIGPDDPDFDRTLTSALQYTLEFEELIKEKFNHPSIIVWVPFNEGWGQYSSVKVGDYIKFYDPSRLVNVASGWTDRKSGDIHDIHAYPGPAMPELEKNRAVALGEFGGLGLPVENHTWQSQNNWGYRNITSTSELENAYTNLISDLLKLKKEGLSAAVYTQTTDVEGEVNGLMSYDRKVNKIDPEILAKINSGYVPPLIYAENSIFTGSVSVTIENFSPSGEIRYSLDGSEPAKESLLYQSPILLKKTTQVKAKVFWPDGSSSKISEAKFRKTKLTRASKIKAPAQGISYLYYENEGERWTEMPDWESRQITSRGKTDSINIGFRNREEDFGFVFDGFIKIEQDGVYSFYLESDDGSQLFINDMLIVNNGGVHGMEVKKGDIALAKGFHKIRIYYFQGTGGNGLKISYSVPGIKQKEIPGSALFRKE